MKKQTYMCLQIWYREAHYVIIDNYLQINGLKENLCFTITFTFTLHLQNLLEQDFLHGSFLT